MNSELIKKTENKISDALNHRYNNQVPHSAECVTSRQLGKILRFPLKEEHTELQLKSDSEIDAQIFEYQLPQTRIFCTLIQTLELKIYLVTYFNKVIVIIDPRFTEGKQNIQVFLTTDTEFVAPPGLKAVNNNLYLISGIANFLFALNINKNLKMDNIPRTLNSWINNERQNHPLSGFSTSNINDLKLIDKIWARLSFIDEKRAISEEALEYFPGYFLWIQEVYIHLGWYNELDDFYKLYLTKTKIQTSQPFILLALKRYYLISKTLGREIDLEDNSNKEIESSAFRFLQTLVNGCYEQDHENLRDIQNFWNIIQLPVMGVYFKNLVKSNPNELIAFCMLAVTNNFSWYRLLKQRIFDELEGDYSDIFSLLCILKENASLGLSKNHLIFSRYGSEKKLNNKILQNKNIVASYHSFGKTSFTEFNHADQIQFRIDKEVLLKYNYFEKLVEIQPKLFQPPFVPSEFNQIQLSVKNNKLKIPIIWNQFIIHFQGMRFKFLRKKNKLQITLRFSPGIDEILINETKFSKTENKYLRFTYDFEKVNSRYFFVLQNESYSDLEAAITKVSKVGIRVFGIDRFGILNQIFRITSGRSLKSIEQKSEMLDLAKLPVSAGYQEFTCHASKMNQFNFEIESTDLILFKLLHNKPYELFNTLRIYLENYDEPYTEYLNYLFFELLGMIPEIKPFEDFRFDKKFISIIIGNLIKDKLVYELRILSEKPVKKVIYINRELIKHIAKIITISNLSGENKFDFKMFNV